MNAARVDRSAEEEELVTVGLVSSDLKSRSGSHVAAFLVIVAKEATEEELGRRLGSCHVVVDDVGQDDVEAVVS
jgi:hypothetical protein